MRSDSADFAVAMIISTRPSPNRRAARGTRQPVHARQHQVEHDEVGRCLAQARHDVTAGAGDVNHEAVFLEVVAHEADASGPSSATRMRGMWSEYSARPRSVSVRAGPDLSNVAP